MCTMSPGIKGSYLTVPLYGKCVRERISPHISLTTIRYALEIVKKKLKFAIQIQCDV